VSGSVEEAIIKPAPKPTARITNVVPTPAKKMRAFDDMVIYSRCQRTLDSLHMFRPRKNRCRLLRALHPQKRLHRFFAFDLAGVHVSEDEDYRLTPFVRWERYNMGARYAGVAGPLVPAGLVPLSERPGDYGYWPHNQDRVWTVGGNFYVTPHVVFKADYQWFDLNADFNRFDVGLGLNF
jgi:hypothetical protein